jgi:hypothetical protein
MFARIRHTRTLSKGLYKPLERVSPLRYTFFTKIANVPRTGYKRTACTPRPYGHGIKILKRKECEQFPASSGRKRAGELLERERSGMVSWQTGCSAAGGAGSDKSVLVFKHSGFTLAEHSATRKHGVFNTPLPSATTKHSGFILAEHSATPKHSFTVFTE